MLKQLNKVDDTTMAKNTPVICHRNMIIKYTERPILTIVLESEKITVATGLLCTRYQL